MRSYSKEGQDIFVTNLIKTGGYFLDIGAGNPVKGNNTYLLELLGWKGILIDNDASSINQCKEMRVNPSFCADVHTINWRQFLRENNVPKIIDYISLDVDDSNSDFMRDFPFDEYAFKLMTFETDAYNNGTKRKAEFDKALAFQPNYMRLAEDVTTQGLAFEDWVINKKFFDSELQKLAAKNINWKDYLDKMERAGTQRPSVSNFYNKESDPEYYKKYNTEHRPRFDFLFKEFSLADVKNYRIGDFGGGTSEILARLDPSNEKHCFDGAQIDASGLPFEYHMANLDQKIDWQGGYFDLSIASEVLEHLASPYTAVEEIKRMTKIGGRILITIPDIRMTHNSPYFPLFYPETNFEAWLDQMALPRLHKALFNVSWPSWCYLCENRPWSEKKLAFPKHEAKFIEATPLESTNI